MRRILITGGSGFIGSYFVDLCLSRNIEVINYDAMFIGSMEEHGPLKHHKLYTFKKIDLSNDNFDLPNDIQAIVHFAAESHVDRSIEFPDNFINSNIIGTFNLLKKCLNKNIRFHLVSTDEVYGDIFGVEGKSNEQSSINSSSPYSASKAAAEQLVMSWGRTYGLDYTITRGCNTVGERQFKEKLLPRFIHLAENNLSLPVYGDGSATRCYIYVKDHVDAIWEVLTKGKSGEIYNVGSNTSFSINDIVDFLKRYYPNIQITDNESRPGHDLRYDIDFTKISNELGWSPKIIGERILSMSIKGIRSYNTVY